MQEKMKKIGIRAGVILFWLLVWQGISMLVQQEILMVSPARVLQRIVELGATAEFWYTTGLSLVRIGMGFLLGVLAGTLLAVLTTRFKAMHYLFAPVLSIMRATPVTSFILLAFVWITAAHIPTFICLLMVVPIVWKNVSEGIAQTDNQLLEMAKVMEIGTFATVTKIYMPSVKPYFMAACTTALGLAWKAGVAAEVITHPKYGIGSEMYFSKVELETADLFAWTIVVIVLSVLCEKALVYLMKRRGRLDHAQRSNKNI